MIVHFENDHLCIDSKSYKYSDISKYRMMINGFLWNTNALGFLYKAPCIELIFHDNSTFLIFFGYGKQNITNILSVADNLKRKRVKSAVLSKPDYMLVFFAAVLLLPYGSVNVFHHYLSHPHISLGLLTSVILIVVYLSCLIVYRIKGQGKGVLIDDIDARIFAEPISNKVTNIED
jgi:hypothetical protein